MSCDSRWPWCLARRCPRWRRSAWSRARASRHGRPGCRGGDGFWPSGHYRASADRLDHRAARTGRVGSRIANRRGPVAGGKPRWRSAPRHRPDRHAAARLGAAAGFPALAGGRLGGARRAGAPATARRLRHACAGRPLRAAGRPASARPPGRPRTARACRVGTGVALGACRVVPPPGSALPQLPASPLLAALPPGLHTAMSGWLEPPVLALPYLAGVTGGLLLSRSAPGMPLDAAPLWGLASGVACGCLLGLLAAFSGGPLGGARLAAVGPSGWQAAVVGALRLGGSAAISAGVANCLGLRQTGSLGRANAHAAPARVTPAAPVWAGDPAESGHVIYLDPWAGDRSSGPSSAPAGPSALP